MNDLVSTQPVEAIDAAEARQERLRQRLRNVVEVVDRLDDYLHERSLAKQAIALRELRQELRALGKDIIL